MHLRSLTRPTYLLSIIMMKCNWLFPTKLYLKWLFRLRMGYKLDLKNPKTFSEKLQWLKLYNRKPEYTQMVDKAAVKDYVAKILGKEYIIPTLGIWNKPEDIDFESLPNRFVLKTTHGGGSAGVVICKDKSTFDCKKAIRSLNKSMKQDISRELKEWPYKNVVHRIIAEEYVESRPDVDELPDYKVFCFNGKPKFCQVVTGRIKGEPCFDTFDLGWKHQPFREPKKYPNADPLPQKPLHYDEILKAAEKLAGNNEFSRIDFYEIGDKILFGEITFFPTSGMGGFDPEDYDLLLGRMITLPGTKRGG